MIRPWTVLSNTLDRSYKILKVRKELAISPRNNNIYEFLILDSSPWVNVIPITQDQRVVMIRQYRHGIKQVTLEIPGGLVEDRDTPESAALRELREETGYGANHIEPLGFVHPNPAIQSNLCYTFLATDLYLDGPQEQDEKEDIQVLLVPLRDIPGLIRDGIITHSLVIVAFYRLFVEKGYLTSLPRPNDF